MQGWQHPKVARLKESCKDSKRYLQKRKHDKLFLYFKKRYFYHMFAILSHGEIVTHRRTIGYKQKLKSRRIVHSPLRHPQLGGECIYIEH